MSIRATILLLALCIMFGSAARAANEAPVPGDPSDVSRGKPQDISQELFVVVRRQCAAQWVTDFEMREYCESKQFNAIRKLRGDK